MILLRKTLTIAALFLAPSIATAQESLDIQITEWTVPWPDTRPRDPDVAPDGTIWLVGQGGHGWFEDTIPATYEQIGPIAFLHLDADWYLSTQICLEYLYPLLVPGGILEIDDVGLSGCDQALKEYGLWDELTISPHEFGAWLVKDGLNG